MSDGPGGGPARPDQAAGHRSARLHPRYPDERGRSEADRHRELRRRDDRPAPPIDPAAGLTSRATRGGPVRGEEQRRATREVDTRPRLGARGPGYRQPVARPGARAGGPEPPVPPRPGWPLDASVGREPLAAPRGEAPVAPAATVKPGSPAGVGVPVGADGTGAGRAGAVRWLRREVVFASVLVGVAAGLVLVYQDRWRRGMLVVGITLVLAGLARLALPAGRVGLLAVRGRLFDTVILLLFGASVITLTSAVPYLGP